MKSYIVRVQYHAQDGKRYEKEVKLSVPTLNDAIYSAWDSLLTEFKEKQIVLQDAAMFAFPEA